MFLISFAIDVSITVLVCLCYLLVYMCSLGRHCHCPTHREQYQLIPAAKVNVRWEEALPGSGGVCGYYLISQTSTAVTSTSAGQFPNRHSLDPTTNAAVESGAGAGAGTEAGGSARVGATEVKRTSSGKGKPSWLKL